MMMPRGRNSLRFIRRSFLAIAAVAVCRREQLFRRRNPAGGFPPTFAIAAGNDYTVALVRDPAPSLTILRNADQTLSLSWRGVGALEQTGSLTPPNWQPVPSQANPQT